MGPIGFSIWNAFAFSSPQNIDIWTNFNLGEENKTPPNPKLWKGGICQESRLQNYLLKKNIIIKGLLNENIKEYFWRKELTDEIKKLI